MDVSRLKKVLAGVSVAAISFTQMGVTAFAAYSDVQSGVWYQDAVESFTEAGYLDSNQTRFRGGDNANRAEFVKLIVELNGGVLSTPPAVPSFTDVASGAWYYTYMEEAAKEGWVRGDKDCYGTKPCYARPGANINRAEAAALIVRAFSLEATGDASQFVDNPSGQWYTDAIQAAADHCVLQGDDTTGRVRPSDSMNRAEMVVMLYRVDQNLAFGVDCGLGNVETPAISAAEAIDAKTVAVDFTVNLDQTAAEMIENYTITAGSSEMTILSATLTGDNSVELDLEGTLDSNTTYTITVSDMMTDDGDDFSDSATFKGYSAIPQGDGELEISVASNNPMGDTVPKGANGVTLLSLDIAASCADDVMIEDLTILQEGFGDTIDIDGVYASVDGARVSRKRTIDSKDRAATLHFTHPLTVQACKSVTLDLLADFSTAASTSAEHSLVVELPSDVMSNAKSVTGSFPMHGKVFRIGAVTSGLVSIAYRSVTPSEVNVGDKAVELGRFEVSTNSVEDQTLYSVTMQQNGTASDGDVTNMKIRRSDGTVLTNTVASTDGDYATFVFDPPFIVKQGDKVTLELVGDVAGGAGESVNMQIEESSDLFAVGSLYGYGVNGQLYGSRIVIPASNANTVSIQAGEFTISIDGPAQQTYTPDQDDAIIANVNFMTGDSNEKIDVRKMFVLIQAATGSGAGLQSQNSTSFDNVSEVLENVSLKNTKTGRSIDAVRLTDSAAFGTGIGAAKTYQVYRFDDFTVADDDMWTLAVDFIDGGLKNGQTVRAYICGEPEQISSGANATTCDFGGIIGTPSTAYQMQLEGLSTGDDITDVRPRGTITGNTQRIATAGLTIAVQDIGSGDTAVKNSKNVNLLRFQARAGEAKDILFTKAIFTASNSVGGSGSLVNAQNYSLWVDTDGNGTVDTKVQGGATSQNSQVTFSDLTGGGFVIPKEKTVVFEVHADIAGSFTTPLCSSGTYCIRLAFDTAATNYVEAEDVIRGSSLSGIVTNGSGTGDITVTTTTSQKYTLVNQGDLFVTKDTVETNRQCLGGTLCESVLRLAFRAQNENVEVTDLQISSSGSTVSSVDRLELYKEGATTPFITATTGGCGTDETFSSTGNLGAGTTATFCAKMQSKQLVVEKGKPDIKVFVRPRLKNDESGATPNQPLQFQIDPTRASNNATGSGAVRARGIDSSNNLSALDTTALNSGEIFIGTSSSTAVLNTRILGERSTTVLSKITSITNAHPAANGTAIPTGTADLGMFKIAAAANTNSKNGLNKVTLSGVIFNVNATNVILTGTSFVFYKLGTPTVTKACQARTSAGVGITGSASGSFLVNCIGLATGAAGNPDTAINQGTDATFVLQGAITNPKVANTNSTLQVSIQNFTSYTASVFGATTSHFEWVDADNSATTTATFLWVEYPTATFVNSTTFQG